MLAYRRVVLRLLWPRRLRMVARLTPPLTRAWACPWRRSCREAPSRPAALA